MIIDLTTEQLHARLATVVGAEYVSAVPADALYGGLLGPGRAYAGRLRALVQPASAEQLQRLAPMIAELAHGLWWTANASGNGAFAGHNRKPGVLVDLSRMNRIIDIDKRGAYAVIEAGVSFDQLAAELRERDLPLWLDADANGAHAVAGSIATRQWGLTPYGDHQAALCGLDAVLANGTLVRTGMGGLPGSDCGSRYKYAFGPALDGLFARGHFGIVTRLGLWLMPPPRRILPFMMRLPDLATVAAVIERLRPLQLDGTLPGRVLIASRLDDAALLARADPDASHADAPAWALYAALYGLPDNVELHWQTVQQACAGLSGTQLSSEGIAPAWALRQRQLRGESVYSASKGEDASALSFTLLAPARGADALALHHGVLARLSEFAPQISFQLAPRLLAMQVELPVLDAEHANCRNDALAAIKDLVGRGYGLRHGGAELDDTLAALHTPAGLHHLYDGLQTALDPYATFAVHGRFKLGKD
jgi:4-cresol dehydrogenase (hydroxylating)